MPGRIAYLLPKIFQEYDLQGNLKNFNDSIEYLNVLLGVFKGFVAGERSFDDCEATVHQEECHGEPQECLVKIKGGNIAGRPLFQSTQ